MTRRSKNSAVDDLVPRLQNMVIAGNFPLDEAVIKGSSVLHHYSHNSEFNLLGLALQSSSLAGRHQGPLSRQLGKFIMERHCSHQCRGARRGREAILPEGMN